MRHFELVDEGVAEALGTKLKEKKRRNFSGDKAAFTLSAQSLLSPFFTRFFWILN
jgi:hypothetical protein